MGDLMRTIAFLTQKGGAGKTTLAASLAVAAAGAGERVIVLDLDPQASLARWGKRREAANVPNKVMIDQLEGERLPRLRAFLEGLNDGGFTLAILDTAGADSVAARLVTETADLCLLPARPTRLDVEATAATFRACYSGEAESRIRPQPVPADLPQFASERRGKRPNAPWGSSRAYVVCAHRFSGCDRRGPRCHRVRPREQGGAGNRSVLGLDSRPVGRVRK